MRPRAPFAAASFVIALPALLTSACTFQQQTSVLAPSTGSNGGGSGSSPAPSASYLGTWGSDTTLPSPSSCTNFQWNITSQTADSMAGDFSVLCANVRISGDATGQLNGNRVALSVSGTAVFPGLPACPFSLNGTGTRVDENTLTIPYSGTTCLGPVRGNETLRRRTNPPPSPAPPTSPPPPPPPGEPDPTLGCGDLTGDKPALVTCIHDRLNPPHTAEGAFDVTRRVAWALQGEGAGLLIKNAGENIVAWQGYSFSASRVCYPDGHIFKALSDVPTTNGPIWLDNGFVDPALCVPAINPNR